MNLIAEELGGWFGRGKQIILRDDIDLIFDELNINNKVFIKPYDNIKSFTGQVVWSKNELLKLIEDCDITRRKVRI